LRESGITQKQLANRLGKGGNVLQVQSNQAVVCKCALIVWTLPSRQSHTIKIKRPLWKDIN
jgi:hypothetical protein